MGAICHWLVLAEGGVTAHSSAVGLFDTVVVGTRRGQVKCFGRGLRTIHAGDVVSLYEQLDRDTQTSRLDSARPDAFSGLAADLAIGERSELRDFQVAMKTADGCVSYLIVRDGVLGEWSDSPAHDLPRIDNRGRPFDESTGRAGVELPDV